MKIARVITPLRLIHPNLTATGVAPSAEVRKTNFNIFIVQTSEENRTEISLTNTNQDMAITS